MPAALEGRCRRAAEVELCLVDVVTATPTLPAADAGGAAADDDDADVAAAAVRRPHRQQQPQQQLPQQPLLAKLLALLTFWGLSALTALFFFLPTNLGALSDRAGGTNTKTAASALRFWWSVAPGQALLQIASLKSMAQLTVSFSNRNAENHKHAGGAKYYLRRPSAPLVVAFAATAIVFVAAPEFAFERAADDATREFDRGNCTAVSSIPSAVGRDLILKACPRFAAADGTWDRADLMALAPEIEHVVDLAGSSNIEAILEVAGAVDQVRSSIPLLASVLQYTGSSTDDKNMKSMLSDGCAVHFLDAACSTLLPRCDYATCNLASSGAICSTLSHLEQWGRCSINVGGGVTFRAR